MTPLPFDSAAGELVDWIQLLPLVLLLLLRLQVVLELPVLLGVAPSVPPAEKAEKVICRIHEYYLRG